MYTRAAARGGLNSVYLCHKKDHLAAGWAGPGWAGGCSLVLHCCVTSQKKTNVDTELVFVISCTDNGDSNPAADIL